jgi:hypothetical protein
LPVCCLDLLLDPLVSDTVRGTVVPHFAPPERDDSSAGERRRQSRASTGARRRRSGGVGGDLGCGGGGLRRWSVAREVVSGGGEGVGAIAQHRRRLRPRRRILHGEASSTAQHSPWRSIDDGIVHGAAQHRARHSIEDGERSARRFLRLVFLRREIFTARECARIVDRRICCPWRG